MERDNIVTIEPGTPAYAEMQRAVAEGRRFRAVRVPIRDGEDEYAIQVKVGEGMWTYPIEGGRP